jgi:hypothetical protein
MRTNHDTVIDESSRRNISRRTSDAVPMITRISARIEMAALPQGDEPKPRLNRRAGGDVCDAALGETSID